MDVNQIYSLVNEVNAQAFGRNGQNVVDGASLVALGNTVLSSDQNSEIFLNSMAMRVGRTIFSFRMYRNQLADFMLNDFEWGAVLQKITVKLGKAESDPAANLVDGQSVDQWVVNKPDVDQKLFVKITPYMYTVTIQRKYLKMAFTGPEGMQNLISLIMGQMRNLIEKSLEDLARVCMANFMAEVSGTSARVVDLLTMYNTLAGTSLTATNAVLDPAFLRYAVKTIQTTSDRFTDLSIRFNDGTIERHTPKEYQRLFVYSEFEEYLRTVVQYDAFHSEMVAINAFKKLNFWQTNQDGLETNINIKRASDGATVQINNIVGFLFDRDALGIYRRDEEVHTTPVNAFGLYYNTAWHEEQLWFNDMSEQGVIFTLGPVTPPTPATPTTETD